MGGKEEKREITRSFWGKTVEEKKEKNRQMALCFSPDRTLICVKANKPPVEVINTA